MAVRVETGGPMAKALEGIITPKLLEVGWSSDPQDNTLTEYIVLMLANGKSQDEVARELSGDLLGLSPDDQSTAEFAQWLFQQIDVLNDQMNGSANQHGAFGEGMQIPTGPLGDADMGDSDRPMYVHRALLLKKILMTKRPTGPKAMRAGTTGNRMFGQISRNMDRPADPLHRIQGANGRINSHSRGRGRAGRNDQVQRNFEGAARRQLQQQANMNPMAAQQAFGFNQMQDPNTMMMRMLEEQAAMFQQLAAQHGLLPNQVNQMGNGKSHSDRGRGRGNRRDRGGKHHQSSAPATQDDDTAMGDGAGSEANDASKDPYKTLCKFNLYCTKPDCAFAHQSPVAPQGSPVDLESDCTFGVACKNFKCHGRHPSPAKKAEHQQQQECKFGPYCTNPSCAFKHSNAKPCRNGADCSTPDCPFYHTTMECKFNPCTNLHCQYKHKEGQKTAQGNVWKSGEEHLSDRKFVSDEDAPEEVIIPGASSNGGTMDVSAPPAEVNALSS
jgi:nuclear polyadenylated RNA-binding protein NAB2